MPNNSIRILLVFAAVVGVVALCGCGGGSGGSTARGESTASGGEVSSANAVQGEDSGSGAALSKEEFVERANAICNRGKHQGYAAMLAYLEQHKNSRKPESQRMAEAIQAAYLPRIETQIEEIRALDAPEGEGWQVKALVVALKEGIYSENRSSTNAQFTQAFEHSARLARTLGINACVYK